MAGSLRAGLAAVPRGANGALISTVDQPHVRGADLMRLVGRWRRCPGRPAAAYYQGRAGVPAVFPRRLFGMLRAIEGDMGARQMLRRAGDLTLLAMPAAAVDIDSPADAAMLGRALPDTTTLER